MDQRSLQPSNLRKKSHDHIEWMEGSVYHRIYRKWIKLTRTAPFYEVDPLINTEEDVPEAVRLNDENAEYFITPSTEIEDENGGWELEGEPINNIFDILDDLLIYLLLYT